VDKATAAVSAGPWLLAFGFARLGATRLGVDCSWGQSFHLNFKPYITASAHKKR